MDPLSALREYAMRGEVDRISRSGDLLRFGEGEYSFRASSETAYRSKQGSRYTLDSLLFFLRHSHLKHTDYLQSARHHRLPAVTFPDRQPLLDYLLGRSSSSDQILLDIESTPTTTTTTTTTNDIQSMFPTTLVPEPPPIDYVSMIRALERPLKDREALLECRSRDFHAVLLASQRREEERHRAEAQQRKDGLVARSRLLGSDDHHHHHHHHNHNHHQVDAPKPRGGKIGEGVPIILVPSALQTLITIYNVREFLEDGVFVPTEVKVKASAGAPKPECVTVQKKLSSRDRAVAAYEVRDKPTALKKEDWDRVVAVFVLGKEWQFKDWPFKDHVDIFNKIIGFYVRFEDDTLESNKLVKQWNVKIISISKHKRHQDRAAALEVWERLEAFMRSQSHT